MAHAPTPTAADLFSEEQIERFLGMIRQGIGRHLAAQAIGATGSLMRSLCRRERDPDFAERYEQAVAEGQDFYADLLAAESRSRATTGRSDRMLEVELATHVPEYAHLRRDRVQVSGQVNHAHAVTLVLDPEVLDQWPREKLLEFRNAVAELAAGEADPAPVIDINQAA